MQKRQVCTNWVTERMSDTVLQIDEETNGYQFASNRILLLTKPLDKNCNVLQKYNAWQARKHASLLKPGQE